MIRRSDMFIYLDNAATTRVSDAALNAMLPYFRQQYGNPSSLYAFGQEAKDALERARETVAGVLNCEPREIIFTSGGSEADNQAIRSAAAIGARAGKRHIISTAFEHHAVLHTLSKLERETACLCSALSRLWAGVPPPARRPCGTPRRAAYALKAGEGGL